jgi:predicted nucleic acid-binding protein
MKLPDWVEVRSAPLSNDPALSLLDEGERFAILLAQSEAEVLLPIDEAAGRLETSMWGIANTGTVGVLRAASIA